MNNLKEKLLKRSFLVPFAGVIFGTAGGFAYYYFIGCSSGTCAITSNPWLSMLWGASVGYLIFDMFSGRSKKTIEKTEA
jgi:hypothetical protein